MSLYKSLPCAVPFRDLFHHHEDNQALLNQLLSIYFNFSSFKQANSPSIKMESYVAPTQTTGPVNARGSTGQCIVM
ncbi:hypothetical protein MGYG_07797 [Nannizzia gypsea CBS 118893]|uniref:Uncharacterized protein n=1 Tax=Arthroderma gypseum (strain ATCC MYA-4604 / CBS 118893) TaxID=535722 RepID=E4V466_ARTGP|nr:hypothetical protein MGYG_07797 [Nannizzia gypsea CBS 118893]EFR04790.1 hypothetical protein MGYG_07797 [Nannizzia gypsea CBS 118893]